MAPYPFLLAASGPPLADSVATAEYAAKTPDPVKRRGPCEGFYGSCAVYGTDGQLTTITITAPGAPTTVYGPAQTIHQTTTQTLTGKTITRISTLIEEGTTKEQKYCAVTVAGSGEITDIECHTGAKPKTTSALAYPRKDDSDDWDSTWIIGIVVTALVLALLGLVICVWRRRKKSYAKRGQPVEASVKTHPESVAPAVVVEKEASVHPSHSASQAQVAAAVAASRAASAPASQHPVPPAVPVVERVVEPEPVHSAAPASVQPRSHQSPPRSVRSRAQDTHASTRCHRCHAVDRNVYNINSCRCPQEPQQAHHNNMPPQAPPQVNQHFYAPNAAQPPWQQPPYYPPEHYYGNAQAHHQQQQQQNPPNPF